MIYSRKRRAECTGTALLIRDLAPRGAAEQSLVKQMWIHWAQSKAVTGNMVPDERSEKPAAFKTGPRKGARNCRSAGRKRPNRKKPTLLKLTAKAEKK